MKPSLAASALAALGAALLAGRPAGGAAGGLDLAAVAAAADAGAAGATDPHQVRAYRKVRKVLAPASAGLPSDLGRLKVVGKACAGALAGDASLRGSLADALDAAEALLRALDVEAVGLAGGLAVPRHRDSVLVAAAKARAHLRAGEIRRVLADEGGAAARYRKSATGFGRAKGKALRLRAAETPRNPVWDVPLVGRGGALLGVWGEPGPEPRLHVVGADDGGGPQFLVLHPGAEGWVRLPVAASGSLWWVTGVPGDGAWACGTEGRVVRYDAASSTLADRSTGIAGTLFGIWGTGPTDVWAVGGDPSGIGPTPAILHWDGGGWTAFPAPASAEGRVLYKVWGAAADDVWAVGEGGVLLHYAGADWTAVSPGTASTLLTVHGPSPVAAVGGGASAVVVERGQDGTWGPVPVTGVSAGTGSQIPGPVYALNGVFAGGAFPPIAVGNSRSVVRRGASGWTGVPGVPAAVKDLHSVWVDDEGNAVMAGGKLANLAEGQLVTFGKRRLPSAVATRTPFRGPVSDLLYLNCAHSGCHLPPFIQGGFAMDTPEITRAAAVSVPSTQSPLLRVAPGRPSQSYLWHKLLGTHLSVGGTGDRMPVLHDTVTRVLNDQELDLVRAWILDGARDD